MDARIVRTKRDLSEALLTLLESNDYDSIKVVDICNKALISKVTFYNNFRGKNDLLKHILTTFEESITNELTSLSSKINSREEYISGMIRITCRNIKENKLFLSKIINKDNNTTILNELRNFIFSEILKNYESLISDNKKSIPHEYVAAFYSGAIVSLLPEILKENTEIDDSLIVKLFA